MARRLMHSIGIKKLGGMALVLSFVAMACVAGQPGTHLNDPMGVGSGGPNTNEGGKDPDGGEPKKVEPKCPPDSKPYKNYAAPGGASIVLDFTCADGSIGSTTVPPGGSVEFSEGCGEPAGDGSTVGCGPNCQCISCGITKLWRGDTELFSCEMQNAYSNAYGIDLAAIDDYTATDLNRPKKIYDVDGHLIRLRYFAIPVIDGNGEFVEWELTTVKPNFSVE
ncbi:MAG: hypothetical protein GXP29_13005, partial [Planctomycetes bacterium]|nr:hypothetical protein [Planctomycetota bacterium]